MTVHERFIENPDYISPANLADIQNFVHLTQRKTGWLMFGGEKGRYRFDDLFMDSATRLIIQLRQSRVPRFVVKDAIKEICAEKVQHKPALQNLAVVRANLLIQYIQETGEILR